MKTPLKRESFENQKLNVYFGHKRNPRQTAMTECETNKKQEETQNKNQTKNKKLQNETILFDAVCSFLEKQIW